MGLPTVPIPGRRGAWNTCCRGGGKAPKGTGQTGDTEPSAKKGNRRFRTMVAGMSRVGVHKSNREYGKKNKSRQR